MNKIVFVTGGARSGKSDFAENLCKSQGEDVAYIATSIPFDDGMRERIKRHRNSRPSTWKTYEMYKDIHKNIKSINNESGIAILDCVTLLVNNLMFDKDIDYETASIEVINNIEEDIISQIQFIIDEIRKSNLYFVFVSNEIGLGIVPSNRLSSIYRDIVGKANTKIASNSDEAYFVISSIPMKIKG